MKRDVWVFLFCLGILLFCGPFLTIFRNNLAYYLFTVWLLFIGFIFLAATSSERDDGGN